MIPLIRNLSILAGITVFLLSTNFAFSFGTADSFAPRHSLSDEKAVPAQQSFALEKDEPTIKLGTDLVMLDVMVIDPASHAAVMNMERMNFQILEDKVPQTIEFFSKEELPVSVVFTIDTSGSMRLKLDAVVKAAVHLVEQSRLDDEIALISFKDSPQLLGGFTRDTGAMIRALKSLEAGYSTAMLDAVYRAADYARTEANNRRRALVVVTDGLDRRNRRKFNDVVQQLRESDVQIYLIGFTQDLDDRGGIFVKSQKGKAEALLTKLAADTGGRAFFPKSLSEVELMAQQISSDLRTQYAIGYYSTNGRRDGSFRSVKVQINTANNRRLVARTRSGYYAQ